MALQAKLGVPHSRNGQEVNSSSDVITKVGPPHMKINAFRLSFWGGDTAHNNCEDVHTRVGTLHIKNVYKCSD